MDCESARDQLGLALDDELTPEARRAVEAHLASCPRCAEEFAALRSLASGLSTAETPTVPENLWGAIEQALDRKGDGVRKVVRKKSFLAAYRQPLAMAASVLVVLGAGLFTMSRSDLGASRVEAATIDYSVLLDALPFDPSKAFRKFLVLYGAQELTPNQVKQHAPELSFEIPEILPGGFRLKAAYGLRVQDTPGIAAEYSRDGEFLGLIFHSPVQRENYGTHKDTPCVIGKHRGHKVEVGPWKLLHFTDTTTCHCVLSRLDEEEELPAIVAAVAPNLHTGGGPHDHSTHSH